ncbi:hypothetical protein M0804_013773, partial [Polistes exclamans]
MEYIDTLIAKTAIIIISYYIIRYLINKFSEYNMIKGLSGPKAFPLIGNLYLLLGAMEALKWATHRKLLNEEFKESIHSTHMDSILKNTKRLVTNLETTNGENIDILHHVHLCTLDIVYGEIWNCFLNV